MKCAADKRRASLLMSVAQIILNEPNKSFYSAHAFVQHFCAVYSIK